MKRDNSFKLSIFDITQENIFSLGVLKKFYHNIKFDATFFIFWPAEFLILAYSLCKVPVKWSDVFVESI